MHLKISDNQPSTMLEATTEHYIQQLCIKTEVVCGIYLLSHKTYGGIDCFQYISKPVEGSSIHIPPMGGIYFELPLFPYPFENVI